MTSAGGVKARSMWRQPGASACMAQLRQITTFLLPSRENLKELKHKKSKLDKKEKQQILQELETGVVRRVFS